MSTEEWAPSPTHPYPVAARRQHRSPENFGRATGTLAAWRHGRSSGHSSCPTSPEARGCGTAIRSACRTRWPGTTRCAATAVTDAGGEIFKHTGDGFLAAFDDVGVGASMPWPTTNVRSRPTPRTARSRSAAASAFTSVRPSIAAATGSDRPSITSRGSPTSSPRPMSCSPSRPPRGSTPRRRPSITSVRSRFATSPIRFRSTPWCFPTPSGPRSPSRPARACPSTRPRSSAATRDVDALLELLGRERLVTVARFRRHGQDPARGRGGAPLGRALTRAPAYFVDLASSGRSAARRWPTRSASRAAASRRTRDAFATIAELPRIGAGTCSSSTTASMSSRRPRRPATR